MNIGRNCPTPKQIIKIAIIFHMLNIVLNVFLCYLISKTPLETKYYPQFTDEETKAESF